MEKLKRMIKENRKIVIIVTVLLLSVIGFSSAYFMIGGKQDEFITFKAGTCLSITITEESESINLSNVIPVTIDEGLSYEPYTFTIKNNCDYTTPYQVSLESLNQVENTLGVDYVHVSLEDSLGRRTTEILGNLESTNITNENAYDARKILNGELEGNSTTYYKFRMWLDYDATKEQAAGKTYTSKIVISAKDNVSVDPEIIKIAYQEETSTIGIGEWYKAYTSRVNITDNKDTSISAKYCIDTSKCEPNTDIEITNNSYTYEYPNGSNYLCTQASDSKGNRSVVSCNELIKVDNNNPTLQYSLSDYETGSNNWYQALKIKIEGTDNESGVATIKYCITSSDACTPTEEVNETSTIVTLPANSDNQKVCGSVIDNNGNESEISCSGLYKIDTDNPTVNVSIASSTAGSNGWYKAISIKGTGSDTGSQVATIKYCTTTSDSCTPSTSVSGATATVALSSNASAQKVCYQAIDTSGRTSSTACSNAYSMDNTAPSISITSTSATKNSITVNVSGSDSHSKVATYYYSSNNGSSYVSSTSNSYTFSGLSSGTTYTIKAYVVDKAGNSSSTASKSVTTEKPIPAKDTILANMSTITTRSSFSSTYTSTTTGTIYTAADDYGTSYYFAGNPTDNWVKFAGKYWRIIRINGDGTIRMIYQGTAANTTGTGTQTTTSAFNSSYDNNMYLGYMYTSGSAHGRGTASTIKGVLDTWYNSNLASYASYIANGNGATFCNDRQPSTSNSSLNGSGGTGATTTYYAAYIRLYKGNSASSAAPSFKCADSGDRFSTSIGLVTADEVAYAGGVVGAANQSYYLYTGQYYWTMSPCWFNSSNGGASVFYVYSNGLLSSDHVNNTGGVRPVINLKADTAFSSGNGTSSNPYVVS